MALPETTPENSLRPRKRGCRKFFGCLFLLVLLNVAALAATGWYYWQHPISNNMIKTRVVSRLEKISGMRVAYDSANLYVPQGLYRIQNLQFFDPAQTTQTTPVFAIKQADVYVRPDSIWREKESMIRRVELKEPTRLDIEYDVHGFHLGAQTKFLLQSIENSRTHLVSPHAGTLPFEQLQIDDVKIGFIERQPILPDIDPPQPAFQLNGTLLVSNENDKKSLVAQLTGQMLTNPLAFSEDAATSGEEALATGITATAHINGRKNIEVSADVDKMVAHELFAAYPKSLLNASNLKLSMDLKPAKDKWDLSWAVKSDDLHLLSPELSIDVNDHDVNASASLAYDSHDAVLNIHDMAVVSDELNASVIGTWRPSAGHKFNGEINAVRLGEDYRRLLTRLLPPGWKINLQDDSMNLDLAFAGTSKGVDALRGEASFNNVSIQAPSLPHELTNVTGSLSIDHDQLKINSLKGHYGHTNLALAGAFKGDVLGEGKGNLNLDWNVSANMADLLSIGKLSSKSRAFPSKVQGTFKGSGTYAQAVDLVNPSRSGSPDLQGAILLDNIGFSYPALPAPVSALSGTLRVRGDTLMAESVSGKMEGNKLVVDGFVKGNELFWRDGQVSATISTRLNLANLPETLTGGAADFAHRYDVKGEAESVFAISGPLSNFQSSGLVGAVDLHDVSFTPKLDFMKGSVSALNGRVTWDGDNLQLSDFSALLNGKPVVGSGALSKSQVELHLKGDTTLDNLEITFPVLAKNMQLSGPASFDIRFMAPANGAAPKVAADSAGNALSGLEPMISGVRELMNNAVKNKNFSMKGNIRLKGINVRHLSMPPGRTENGKKIPRGDVTDLTGNVIVNGDTLSISEDDVASCNFADTSNCRISGSLQIRPGNFPLMKIEISTKNELNLDPWIVGWGKDMPHINSPPQSGKEFDLAATIIAPSITYKGLHAGRSRGNLSFHMKQNNSPRVTTFKEIVIQGDQPGQGRIIGSGSIESFVWDPTHYPHWNSSVDVQNMPVESLLTAVFKDPANVKGSITGKMDLQGIGTDTSSVRGAGTAAMTNLELGRTNVIRELGQTTGRNFGGTLFETARAARFEVGNGALSSRDLALQTNGLNLEMKGDYYFAGNSTVPPKTIQGMLKLELFKSVFGKIPIIGDLASLADEMANAFLLAFRVSGTADSPRITPVPVPLFQGGSM